MKKYRYFRSNPEHCGNCEHYEDRAFGCDGYCPKINRHVSYNHRTDCIYIKGKLYRMTSDKQQNPDEHPACIDCYNQACTHPNNPPGNPCQFYKTLKEVQKLVTEIKMLRLKPKELQDECKEEDKS